MQDREVKESLTNAFDLIKKSNGNIKERLIKEAKQASSIGSFMWPLRVALSGKKASAGPDEIINIIGKEKSLKRIQSALAFFD
jgi:glutamyl/glutaminyl-tRNA synthetase